MSDNGDVDPLTTQKARASIRLQELRLRSGLSAADFAEALGVPETTLASYEQGKAQMPASVLGRISLKFGVSVNYFYG